MGFVSHAFRKIFGGGGNVTIQSSGAAAAAPSVDTKNNETNIDTDATKRKRKAVGKKSLMIGNGSDSFGGGTTGTGLNL